RGSQAPDVGATAEQGAVEDQEPRLRAWCDQRAVHMCERPILGFEGEAPTLRASTHAGCGQDRPNADRSRRLAPDRPAPCPPTQVRLERKGVRTHHAKVGLTVSPAMWAPECGRNAGQSGPERVRAARAGTEGAWAGWSASNRHTAEVRVCQRGDPIESGEAIA